MEKTLVILEVSQKQSYIFSSKKLRENAQRSGDISFITSSRFFEQEAGDLYREEENLVYSGGGHTVLQFDEQEQATQFARVVTEAVLHSYPGLELFVKQRGYEPDLPPSENLKKLAQSLEEKKALRQTSFRQLDLGVESREAETVPDRSGQGSGTLQPPEGYDFPADFETLAKAAGEDNFIAVIHIDGNAMGKRVEGVYERQGGDWENCRKGLQRFSEGIQADFEEAFRSTVGEVVRLLQPERQLPIRPVILAGDDVCFVTAGHIGLECARVFLEKLSALTNAEDGKPYAACAGVAIVHTKYPFHRAYDLAEELCSSAKRFGAALDPDGRVCAMDWHIEFGQLKDGLSDLRQDYRTEDGCRLELRPVCVLAPEEMELVPPRTYNYFRQLCREVQKSGGSITRSKVKELRTAMKQGEVETDFFLQDREIGDLLYKPIQAAWSMDQWKEKLADKRAFWQEGKAEKRCLFFDAIEMTDHFTVLEEADV